MKTINIKTIRIDGGTQSRVEINNEIVTEYAQAIKAGAEFPAVVVFNDGVDNWLADGFHRFHAHGQVGKTSILADVRQGTLRDAKFYSWKANQDHGQRRTNGDKRKIVLEVLADDEAGKWSDNHIAKEFGFSPTFVGSLRKSLSTVDSEKPTERTYTTKQGTTATMQTGGIGKKKKGQKAKETSESENLDADVNDLREHFKATGAQPYVDDGAPDEAEAEALRIQEEAEAKTMQFLLASDEPLADLASKNTQLEAQIKQLELRIAGLQNSNNEYIKRIKSLQNQLKKVQA